MLYLTSHPLDSQSCVGHRCRIRSKSRLIFDHVLTKFWYTKFQEYAPRERKTKFQTHNLGAKRVKFRKLEIKF
jgi:hypothetical protein